MSENNTEDRYKQLFDSLSEVAEMQRQAVKEQNKIIDKWWDNLTQQDREYAFYSVCKRIFTGDVERQGSYRYVLYDMFNFDTAMYTSGIDCGYMAIHNAIARGIEYENLGYISGIEIVNSDSEEIFSKDLGDNHRVKYYVDDNKVLKIELKTGVNYES